MKTPGSVMARWLSHSMSVAFLGTACAIAAPSFPKASELPSQPGLPDPLVMQNGKRVATQEQWFQSRRPELKALFEHYVYGTMPPPPQSLQVVVERADKNFFGGKATKKELLLSFDQNTNAPSIHLLLVVPNVPPKKPKPSPTPSGSGAGANGLLSPGTRAKHRGFPVFVGMNPCGNHTLVNDPSMPLPKTWMNNKCPGCVDNHATEAGRGVQRDFVWAIEQSIEHGYAVATFYCGDIEPDLTNAPTGIRAYLGCNSSLPPPKDCSTIAAWAWGISRAVDYLITNPELDASRIVAVGHSRLGKAALLAGAFDDRISMVVPLQSGTGGAAPSRGKTGESVKAINDRFPHWFNDEFKTFNDQIDRLPMDQHCLIALVAPRPVLIGAATEDTWTNPKGQFEMLRAADPVYRLLNVGGLDAKKMPEVNKLAGSRLGYFIRPGKHSMSQADWLFIIDFVDHLRP